MAFSSFIQLKATTQQRAPWTTTHANTNTNHLKLHQTRWGPALLTLRRPFSSRNDLRTKLLGSWALWGLQGKARGCGFGGRGFHASGLLREGPVPPTPSGGSPNTPPPVPPPPSDGRPPVKNPVFYRETLLDKLRAAYAFLRRTIVRAFRYPFLHFSYLFRRTKIVLILLAGLILYNIYSFFFPTPEESLPESPVLVDRKALIPNNTDLFVFDGMNILIDEKLIKLMFDTPMMAENFGKKYRVDRKSVTLRYLPRPLGFDGMPSSIQALSVSFVVYGVEAIGQVEVAIETRVVPRYGSSAMYDVLCKILSVSVFANGQDMRRIDLAQVFGEGSLDTFFFPYLYCSDKTYPKLEEPFVPPPVVRSEMDLPDELFQGAPSIYVPPADTGL